MRQTPVGLLLAAGLGTRFDPSGKRLKLLQPVARGPYAGRPLAWAAAQPLLASLPEVIAVVRPVDHPHQHELHELLRDAGCRLAVCPSAADGMGASIACGVKASADASAWVIALADMPDIAFSTVVAVTDAVSEHECVAPFFDGRRGHPVAFSAAYRMELLVLTGEAGARSILDRHAPHSIAVDDPGVLFDIDTSDAS